MQRVAFCCCDCNALGSASCVSGVPLQDTAPEKKKGLRAAVVSNVAGKFWELQRNSLSSVNDIRDDDASHSTDLWDLCAQPPSPNILTECSWFTFSKPLDTLWTRSTCSIQAWQDIAASGLRWTWSLVLRPCPQSLAQITASNDVTNSKVSPTKESKRFRAKARNK